MLFARIVPLLWATLPLLREAEIPSAEMLYRQAYLAFDSSNAELSTPFLHCLINYHLDSDHAPVAVVTLVELDLIQGRNLTAIERIIQCSDRLFELPAQQDPEAIQRKDRCLKLLSTALSRLDSQEALRLGEQIRTPARPLASEQIVTRNLAKRALQNQQFLLAMELLDRLEEKADASELQLRDFVIPMHLLQGQPLQQTIDMVRDRLESNSRLSVKQSVQLRWSIAEALTQLNEAEAAIEELTAISQWLSSIADSSAADSSVAEIAEGDPIENWSAATSLKLGELLLLTGASREAASIAQLALRNSPQFPARAELRFLLTRCHIADIEFEKAEAQLNNLLSELGQSIEVCSQAYWMLGEIRLMQQRYHQAIEQYSMVLSLEGSSDWHARALLQMARCHEALSSPLQAMSAYRRLIDQYAESELTTFARERLSSLTGSVR